MVVSVFGLPEFMASRGLDDTREVRMPLSQSEIENDVAFKTLESISTLKHFNKQIIRIAIGNVIHQEDILLDSDAIDRVEAHVIHALKGLGHYIVMEGC